MILPCIEDLLEPFSGEYVLTKPKEDFFKFAKENPRLLFPVRKLYDEIFKVVSDPYLTDTLGKTVTLATVNRARTLEFRLPLSLILYCGPRDELEQYKQQKLGDYSNKNISLEELISV